MKKVIRLIVCVMASLCICWIAGQWFKEFRQSKQEHVEDMEEQEGRENDTWSLAEHMDSESVIVEGLVESEDYPYGYNVGSIEDEQVGRAILLTPDTSIGVEGTVSEESALTLCYFLHPWVAEDSDGALLNISITGNGVERDYVYEVGADMEKQTIDLGEYADKPVRILLSVSNGEGCNADCDWIILSIFSFSEGGFREK